MQKPYEYRAREEAGGTHPFTAKGEDEQPQDNYRRAQHEQKLEQVGHYGSGERLPPHEPPRQNGTMNPSTRPAKLLSQELPR